jgi:hypothetical protein
VHRSKKTLVAVEENQEHRPKKSLLTADSSLVLTAILSLEDLVFARVYFNNLVSFRSP